MSLADEICPTSSADANASAVAEARVDVHQPSQTNASWNSSSMKTFTEKAFAYNSQMLFETPATAHSVHNESEFGDPSYRQRQDSVLGPSAEHRAFQNPRVSSHGVVRRQKSSTAELAKFLPNIESAQLLVDTFFDCAHWFILTFRQQWFRTQFDQLYQEGVGSLRQISPSLVSVVLAVIAIGCQYVGAHRRRLLAAFGVDPASLRHDILESIKRNLIDIVSTGSLEAAQTCTLVGSYYLYQGEPGLAWPICGCGLRVALALNLHRQPTDLSNLNAEGLENRKRCWWAIHEIETFCCMLYGYPPSIVDSDCDVPRLHTAFSHGTPSSANRTTTNTLLAYKYLMSELTTLVQAILRVLYNITSEVHGNSQRQDLERLRALVENVTEMDNRLVQWISRLPDNLRIQESTPAAYDTSEQIDHDIRASGPRFEKHILQLQALALKLAYENTRILAHRPLLMYRMNKPIADLRFELDTREEPPQPYDPFQRSIEACRNAALETSRLGDLPVFVQSSGTYAVSFVGMHLLTAGVTLSIMAVLDPLAVRSHQAKVGLYSILKMQTSLETVSWIAAQGLDLLRRLTKLLMERELQYILCTPSQTKVSPRLCTTSVEAIAGEEAEQPRSTRHQKGSSANPVGEACQQSLPNDTEEDTGLTIDLDCNQFLDFYQDPDMTNVLEAFGDVMSTYSVDKRQLDGEFGSSTDDGFLEPEQAWIWGLNLR